MTVLVWDNPGEKIYQTGVDRGVLYLQDGTAVVWNGLTSVEDTTSKEVMSHYLDGMKYLEYISPGDFSANLKAFTYPEEFDSVNGVLKVNSAFRVHDQPSKSFCLSYRTKIGNDLEGTDAGYLIHLLYNVLANPDSSEYSTLGESGSDPTEFSWALSGTPVRSPGSGFDWRPSAHISVDSRDVTETKLQSFEEALYGTALLDPYFPTINEVITLLTPD